jgi:YHS domain-containing protein
VRGLLLVAVLALVVVIYWSLRQVSLRPGPRPGRLRADQLVKDPICSTYVVSARSVRREIEGVTRHFCSDECANRYERERPEGRLGEGHW